MDLQALTDRIEINDLLTRYAHAVDTRDWVLYRTVYTPDAEIDATSVGSIKGDLETFVNWLATSLAGLPMTQHFISNVDVKLDGDAAKVRAMYYNPVSVPNGRNFFSGGWYNHDLVRTPHGWRSRKFVIENAWTEGVEQAFAE